MLNLKSIRNIFKKWIKSFVWSNIFFSLIELSGGGICEEHGHYEGEYCKICHEREIIDLCNMIKNSPELSLSDFEKISNNTLSIAQDLDANAYVHFEGETDETHDDFIQDLCQRMQLMKNWEDVLAVSYAVEHRFSCWILLERPGEGGHAQDMEDFCVFIDTMPDLDVTEMSVVMQRLVYQANKLHFNLNFTHNVAIVLDPIEDFYERPDKIFPLLNYLKIIRSKRDLYRIVHKFSQRFGFVIKLTSKVRSNAYSSYSH